MIHTDVKPANYIKYGMLAGTLLAVIGIVGGIACKRQETCSQTPYLWITLAGAMLASAPPIMHAHCAKKIRNDTRRNPLMSNNQEITDQPPTDGTNPDHENQCQSISIS